MNAKQDQWPGADLSHSTALRIHDALVELYEEFNGVRKPFAARDVTNLVSHKPMDPTEGRTHIGEETFATFADPDRFRLVRLVSRDPVIAALVSKAAATKHAIVPLACAGLGCDAYALLRTLLENVIVLLWLLPEDEARRNERIDTYILHFEAFQVRYEEVVRTISATYERQLPEDFGTSSPW